MIKFEVEEKIEDWISRRGWFKGDTLVNFFIASIVADTFRKFYLTLQMI